MRPGKSILGLFVIVLILLQSTNSFPAIHTFQFGSRQKSDNGNRFHLDREGTWHYQSETDAWLPVVPPVLFTDRDVVTLRCRFQLDSVQTASPIYFESNGFGCITRILLNDKLIHNQVNNSAPFSFELPRHYLNKEGDNTFLFILESASSIAEGFTDFARVEREKDYVGITQPLWLRTNAEKWIDNLHYRVSEKNGVFTLHYSYDVRIRPDEKDEIRLEERFLDSDEKVFFRRSFGYVPGSNPVSNSVTVSEERLWSPETPVQLSAMIFHLNPKNQAVRQSRIRFGIRALRTEERTIFLNGKPLFVKGVTYYENMYRSREKDYSELLLNDLVHIKEMGFNAVRFPHYLPGPTAVGIADSLGLLLFGELPVWRYPAALFKSDRLLEFSKTTIRNLSRHYTTSPSLVALSIGQQIPLHKAQAQKFMLILKNYAVSNLDLLTYLSPVPGRALPAERAADFYVYESRKPIPADRPLNPPFTLAGSISMMRALSTEPADKNERALQFQNHLKYNLHNLYQVSRASGGFIDAYADYSTNQISHINYHNLTDPVAPIGIFDQEGQPKFWSKDLLGNLWTREHFSLLPEAETGKESNLFSIIVFFTTILFFIYYKQNRRFRENMKRALRHPYGFFVDMRERRIIPLFSSIIAGTYYSVILSTFLASFLVYFNDSLYIEEFASALFLESSLYRYFLIITQSYLNAFLFGFLVFFMFPLFLSIFLKFFSWFARVHIRFRQGLAIGFWSGAPFIFMAPFSLIAFHILGDETFRMYLTLIFLIFILWAHIRMINGIRVLFTTRSRKVLIILLLSYCIPLIIFWAILKPGPYWYDYLRYLLESNGLY